MSKIEKDPYVVNGKRYSLWPQFTLNKARHIGRPLVEFLDDEEVSTVITDITFEPNGDDSAMFTIVGKKFSCACEDHKARQRQNHKLDTK